MSISLIHGLGDGVKWSGKDASFNPLLDRRDDEIASFIRSDVVGDALTQECIRHDFMYIGWFNPSG